MPFDRRSLLRGLAAAGTAGAAAGAAGCTSPSTSGPENDPTETSWTRDGPTVDEPRGTGSNVAVEVVADGLTSPVNLVDSPVDDTLYVIDQIGTIREIGPDGLRQEPYLDYTDRVLVSPERGLLGMAFHPDYPEDDRLFLRYSAPRREGTPADYSHTEVLVELPAPPGEGPDVAAQRTLIEFPSPTIYHQAGTILFGPDDYLYVAMGEGTKKPLAQDLESNLLGGIHRIDVDGEESDGDRPYAIPSDNPLVGESGREEYYAWGLRNPWRMSFNDGTLIAGDVGSYRHEEVDVVEKGANYGWPYKEGLHCTGFEDGADSGPRCGIPAAEIPGGEYTDPVLEFPHSGNEPIFGTAVIAGYVYDRNDIAGLNGRYIFSNYASDLRKPSGDLFVATPQDEGQWPVEKFSVANTENGELNRVVNSMGRDEDGRLYLMTVGVPDKSNRFQHGAGQVLRIVPPGTADGQLPIPTST